MDKVQSILNGYTSQKTAYEVKDYPYGFTLRTSIFYWIETQPKKGDRFCSYTINPKTGRANKPKKGTYSTFIYMYLDEIGHVKHGVIDSYNAEIFAARYEFIINKIGVEYLSPVQISNIKLNHAQHLYGNARWTVQKYSDGEAREEFSVWLKAIWKHIHECDFKDLLDYPPAPAPDLPEEEVKFISTTVKEHND